VTLRITATFLLQALELEKPIRAALRKMIGLAEQLSFAELTKHKGVHLEKLAGLVDPRNREALYSLRITLSARATAIVQDGELVLLAIFTDHDQAYRRN